MISSKPTVAQPLITHNRSNTKFIVMVLLGDYIRQRGGAIWLTDMLHLLDLLDVGERTARSTITRMAQEGWFDIQKEGRRSRYVITTHGLSILQSGDVRLAEEPLLGWDKTWHMVAYSLPEEKRKLRNDLRKQLAWLGFGQLGPGLWISPHNRRVELNRILFDWQIQAHVNLFSSVYWGPLTNSQLVQHCWDLLELEPAYHQFLRCHEAEYERFKPESLKPMSDPSPEACFQRRFWLTADFFPLLQQDPNLPTELLPENWVGLRARQLFANYRQWLEPHVTPFIDSIVSGNGD